APSPSGSSAESSPRGSPPRAGLALELFVGSRVEVDGDSTPVFLGDARSDESPRRLEGRSARVEQAILPLLVAAQVLEDLAELSPALQALRVDHGEGLGALGDDQEVARDLAVLP